MTPEPSVLYLIKTAHEYALVHTPACIYKFRYPYGITKAYLQCISFWYKSNNTFSYNMHIYTSISCTYEHVTHIHLNLIIKIHINLFKHKCTPSDFLRTFQTNCLSIPNSSWHRKGLDSIAKSRPPPRFSEYRKRYLAASNLAGNSWQYFCLYQIYAALMSKPAAERVIILVYSQRKGSLWLKFIQTNWLKQSAWWLQLWAL